ncbi:ATP-binding endoribonuclease [Seiridium cupressi]
MLQGLPMLPPGQWYQVSDPDLGRLSAVLDLEQMHHGRAVSKIEGPAGRSRGLFRSAARLSITHPPHERPQSGPTTTPKPSPFIDGVHDPQAIVDSGLERSLDRRQLPARDRDDSLLIPPQSARMATQGLNVIALVSGGKDSFFSILHCQANGHRIVALANLYPPDTQTSATQTASVVSGPRPPGSGHDHRHDPASGPLADDQEDTDLDSFMYQTVGHQVIPLYAAATGLPLFRQPIVGTTVQSGISYRDPRQPSPSSSVSINQAVVGTPDSVAGSQSGLRANDDLDLDDQDETESLVPLLRAVMVAHPEANALCTGAILSTYQRTRIESVALRLGLVPLAYLWQYPVLPNLEPPAPSSAPADPPSTISGGHRGGSNDDSDDAQLLRDMGAVGLEARIVKVASAGLEEDFLWDNVASEQSITRVKRALRRFGGGGRGSVLGEGGEFETLVVDGPPALFKGRIVVGDADRRVVREGGGSTWLSIRQAHVETKTLPVEDAENSVGVRTPGLLDARFQRVSQKLQTDGEPKHGSEGSVIPRISCLDFVQSSATLQRDFTGLGEGSSVEQQTARLVKEIQSLVEPRLIVNTVIVLRQMSDFPIVNKVYGALFTEPNPPSRVTISCGTLLPTGSKIAIYVTFQPGLTSLTRQGLHVQSRSYWAPANIGPYSQAIVFPQGAQDNDPIRVDRHDTPKLVTIAGQIPLIPASMDLPKSTESTSLQITLALQHLWRVGLEMQALWWTSAVAYFPRTPTEHDMKQKADLAARAWQAAHLWSLENRNEDDDESGPDLWDRKYNPQYMSLTGTDESAAVPMLPAWDALNGFDEDVDDIVESQRPLPYVFSAEVEELPRAAGVEWHAHRGLVKVSPGSVYVVSRRQNLESLAAKLELQHTFVNSADEVYIHTIAAVSLNEAIPAADLARVGEAANTEIRESLKTMMNTEPIAQLEMVPYLTSEGCQGDYTLPLLVERPGAAVAFGDGVSITPLQEELEN